MAGGWRRRLGPAAAGACLLATPAWPWGVPAHELTGRLALARLQPAARAAVDHLLDGETLPSATRWADDYRRDHPETKRWHYVDIPRTATAYVAARDCQPTDEGDCLIAALERVTATLRDPHAADRPTALRFLVHLLGDLHQPLHCADDHDGGGNGVQVTFRDRPMNLHALWDSGLVDAARDDDPGFMAQLEAAADAVPRAATIDYVAWAMESHAVAVEDVYGELPRDRTLGIAYLAGHRDVLRRQLARAGARMGDVLNLLLADDAPPGDADRPDDDAPAPRRRHRRQHRW